MLHNEEGNHQALPPTSIHCLRYGSRCKMKHLRNTPKLFPIPPCELFEYRFNPFMKLRGFQSSLLRLGAKSLEHLPSRENTCKSSYFDWKAAMVKNGKNWESFTFRGIFSLKKNCKVLKTTDGAWPTDLNFWNVCKLFIAYV